MSIVFHSKALVSFYSRFYVGRFSIAFLKSASATLPILHAYHAAWQSSVAHSANEDFSSGCCTATDFAYGKSILPVAQFS